MSRLLHRCGNLLPLFRLHHRHVTCRLYHSNDGSYGCRPVEEPSQRPLPETIQQARTQQPALYQLVSAYRAHGHRKSTLDPLALRRTHEPLELNPSLYGLNDSEQLKLSGILNVGVQKASSVEVVQLLEELYCGPLAVEVQHLASFEEREWFASRFEELKQEEVPNERKLDMAKLMLKAQAFDHFVHAKYSSVKRYGGEGAESAMVFYDEVFRQAAHYGIHDVITCIAHRGRLNLLTCLLKFPPVVMFRKMKGKREFPPEVVGTGDVLSHFTSSVDLDYDGRSVHVTMVPNPSHLEAVNPVAVGKARARGQSLGVGDYAPQDSPGRSGDQVLCLQIHGDAAFSAQGVVPETFAMSSVPHFTIGGSVHLIVNNQIGFTTDAERGRSSHHCSDVGKMVDCPVIHVNGDHPEEVLRAAKLATEYRETFRKDVVVNYMCFRKYGHNELDEPSFTQPQMYDVIRNRQSIPDLYAEEITAGGACAREELEVAVKDWNAELADHQSKVDSHIPKAHHLEKQWAGLVQAPNHVTSWDTGLPVDVLKFVGAKSVSLPEDFVPHPTLRKTFVDRRLKTMEEGVNLDWAAAEALAIGSLVYQGYRVRLSGQDVGRGTFSHRHAMLVDQNTDHIHVPFNHMMPEQRGALEVANSILSEEAVLGFEYGMSVENANLLCVWEAQFGDFFNGAQIMIDTFVTGGETKWLLQSGLVLLLPHGLDGAGPEHSSCRMERFLQLCDSKEDAVDGDDVNYQIANPTTPAQYYHLLRRQMVRNYRKPLVVVAPKAILRHPAAVSSLSDMNPGTSFRPVLSDPGVPDPSAVTKVVFVSGKHFYTLQKERETRGVKDVAFVRIESLCPFPAEEIRNELRQFTNANKFIWGQEEHRNSGAWTFLAPRFENIVGCKLAYCGRAVHATPAAGVGEVHQREAQDVVDATFAA